LLNKKKGKLKLGSDQLYKTDVWKQTKQGHFTAKNSGQNFIVSW